MQAIVCIFVRVCKCVYMQIYSDLFACTITRIISYFFVNLLENNDERHEKDAREDWGNAYHE